MAAKPPSPPSGHLPKAPPDFFVLVDVYINGQKSTQVRVTGKRAEAIRVLLARPDLPDDELYKLLFEWDLESGTMHASAEIGIG